MNSLERYFKNLILKGRKLFLPYITLGDPDIESSLRMTKTLAMSGADAIEIGIPFSDPIADGPTIQKAVKRALENKVSLRLAFRILQELKLELKLPILFMSYYNPILKFGEDRFFHKAKQTNLDGIIVPDLAIEESRHFIREAKKIDLATVFFISPTTTYKRIKIIEKISTGFIYYISLTGVTGARKKLASDLIENLKMVKNIISKPLCVGFGISNPNQVKDIVKFSDGIIIGSAIVDIIERNLKNKKRAIKEIFKFSSSIRKALGEKNIGS